MVLLPLKDQKTTRVLKVFTIKGFCGFEKILDGVNIYNRTNFILVFLKTVLYNTDVSAFKLC